MKRLLVILGVCGLILVTAGISRASYYYGPVVLVEADPGTGPDSPNDTDVTFTVSFFDTAWTVGEWDGSGFVAFGGTEVTKSGGDVVDFAIRQDANPTNVLKLSDHSHAVTFLNQNSGYVEVPMWVTDWYNNLLISWSGGPTLNLELATTDGDPDGFAPIPIPGSALLLGSCVLGLSALGIRRKSKMR